MDIEDLVGAPEREAAAPIVAPKFNKRARTKQCKNAEETSCDTATVPGTGKIFTKTFGCAHNVSDGEYMQGILESYGYTFTDDQDSADVWLLNSCTVKDPSQAAFMNLVDKAKGLGIKTVVSGCVPQGEESLKGLEEVSMVGVQQVDRVVEVVEETLKGNTIKLLERGRLPRLDLPKIRKNKLVEIVPLSTGCLGSCTYCKTKHARGELGSYEPQAIVDRISSVISEGVKEVWLSSEDTGAYGRDIGTDLPFLLKEIVKVLPSDVMLRVGMTNPPFILDALDAVAECLNHPNVFAFLHVPVQAGSDSVLKRMNREYTCAEFSRVADFLMAKVPEITLATDIICGFPGETDEDWEETMALCRKYRFHILNISQFYARQGTPAARMTRVKTQIVKKRSKELTAWLTQGDIDPYKCLEGQIRKVWIGNELGNKDMSMVGHLKNYTKVMLPRDDTLRGGIVRARVTKAYRWHVDAVVEGTWHDSDVEVKGAPLAEPAAATDAAAGAAAVCGAVDPAKAKTTTAAAESDAPTEETAKKSSTFSCQYISIAAAAATVAVGILSMVMTDV